MKIWAFINGGYPGFYQVCTLDEEGNSPAGHMSSNSTWAKHDIGVNSNWKHEIYDNKYGKGNWEIERVEDPSENPELMKIINRLNEEEDERESKSSDVGGDVTSS